MKNNFLNLTLIFSTCIALLLSISINSFALSHRDYPNQVLIEFNKSSDIQKVELTVPTNIKNYAVIDQYRTLIDQYSESKYNFKAEAKDSTYNNLVDNNPSTFADFETFGSSSKRSASLQFKFNQAIRTDRITIEYDQSSPGFNTAKLYNLTNQESFLSELRFNTTDFDFPLTEITEFRIDVEYYAKTRIKEIKINSENQTPESQKIAFLALPNTNYFLLYGGPITANIRSDEIYQSSALTTSGKINIENVLKNVDYNEPDQDEDGKSDKVDNCKNEPNPDQADLDNNGIGNACEDKDGDRVFDSKDNCPLLSNSNQNNIDKDNTGDACDKQDDRLLNKNPWILYVAIAISSFSILGVVLYLINSNKKESRK
ncbi:MAG: thrombospondin type 3 repeat-containing protein [Patescibacteria group bacterium]